MRTVSQPAPALLLLALALPLCQGCAESRVVKSNDILQDIPGAQGGLRAETPPEDQSQDWEQLLAGYQSTPGASVGDDEQFQQIDGAPLRLEAPDGSVLLVSKSPSHVMYHLTQTLAKGEDDLLLDQVLADRTKREYALRGRDPAEAVDWLKRHRQDIGALFAAIPMGEQTPGVFLEPLGDNAFRLSAPRAIRDGLTLTEFDVVVEQGRFKLLMLR